MAKKMKLCGLIADDDELLLMSCLFEEKPFFTDRQNKFNLQDMSDEQCKVFFRFTKIDIERLRVALFIPEKVVCRNRTVCSGSLSIHTRPNEISFNCFLTYICLN